VDYRTILDVVEKRKFQMNTPRIELRQSTLCSVSVLTEVARLTVYMQQIHKADLIMPSNEINPNLK